MVGDDSAADGSFVDPRARKFVADQLKDESAIQKEWRKAREERQLAKPKPSPKPLADKKPQ